MRHFFQFNTMRAYSEFGQVIKCMLADDPNADVNGTSIWFYDQTRCIVGKIHDVAKADSEVVMSCYDNCYYDDVSFDDSHIVEIMNHCFGD